MTRYLQKIDDGFVYVWTEELAKRKDMVECAGPAGVEALGGPAKWPSPGGPIGPLHAIGLTEIDAIVAEITSLTDKNEIERVGRAHGVELDRRKTVDNMKRELLAHFGQIL